MEEWNSFVNTPPQTNFKDNFVNSWRTNTSTAQITVKQSRKNNKLNNSAVISLINDSKLSSSPVKDIVAPRSNK